MTRIASIFLAVSFVASFSAGLVACKAKRGTQGPKDVQNLCERYTSCNACITGQQTEGKTEGEAQTECALAVTGCWVTWEKPVACGDKVYEERPE